MSRLARNIVYSVAGQGLLMVLGFVAAKFINYRLGADVLGLYYFSLTVSAVGAAAVELGVSTSVVREVAANHESDRLYVRDLVRTASAFYWFAFSLLVGLAWLSAPLMVGRWVTLESLPQHVGVGVLRVFMLAAFLSLPRLLYASVLQGLQRFGASNAINVSVSAIQQAGTLIVLRAGGRAQDLATWYAVTALAAVALSAAACVRPIGAAGLVPAPSVAVVRRNARFASNAMATTFFGAVLSRLDKLILTSFVPAAALGQYGVSSTIVSKALGIVNSLELAGYPALAKAHRDGKLLAQLRKIDDTICLLSLPAFAAVVFAEGPILGYIFDPSAAARLFWPTALLALGSYMNATVSAPYRGTLAIGRPEFAAKMNLAALLVVPPLSLLLVWQWGIIGAAGSWVLYHLFVYWYFVPRYSSACLGTGPWSFYARVLRIIGIAVICYAGSWLMLASWTGTLIGLMASYFIASVAYLVVVFLLVASPEFRLAVGRTVSSLRNLGTR